MILLGITISSSLLTGINISMEALSTDMFRQNFDTLYCDFSVTSERDFNGEFDYLSNIFEPLKDNFTEVLEVFGSIYTSFDETCYNFNGDSINWTYYDENFFNDTLFTNLQLFGIDEHVFNLTQMADIIEFSQNQTFTITNNSKEIFVDMKSAIKFNLTIGQNISIGHLYQDVDYIGGQRIVTNYTFSEENITIVGFFRITDSNAFESLFPGYYSYSYYGPYYYDYSYDELDVEIKILTNPELAYNFFIKLTNNEYRSRYYSYRSYWMMGIITDHDQYNYFNPALIESFFQRLTREIQYTNVLYYFDIDNHGNNALLMVQSQIMSFSLIIYMISIPVLILGWYLIKTNFFIVLNNRRREIGIFKIRSGSNRQIISIFFLESIILGLVGGLLGVFVGYLSGLLIYTNLSSLHSGLTFELFLSYLPTIKLSTYLIGILFGGFISFLSAYRPIRTYSKLTPSEALQKYNRDIQTEVKIQKRDFALLILSISSIIFSIFFNPTSLMYMGNIPFIFMMILPILFYILPFFLPIAPFVLCYLIVKIVCNYSLNRFTLLVSKITRIFNKKTHFFISRSITGNRARSTRIIAIIAISLSFLIISDAMTASQKQFEHDTRVIYLGGDTNFQISEYWGNNNLTDNGIWPYVSVLSNNGNLNISSVTIHEISESARLFGSSSPYNPYVNLIFLDSDNYTQNMENMDRFIVGRSANEVFSDLKSIPDATIAPSNFLEQNSLAVGDQIIIRYSNKSTIGDDDLIKQLVIVGAYTVLPGVDPGYYYSSQNYLICQRDLIPDIEISHFSMLVHYEREDPTIEFFSNDDLVLLNTKIINEIEEFDPTINVNEQYSYMFSGSAVSLSMLDFLTIEKFYLLTFVALGIGIIMYNSIQEKSLEFGLLRAKGTDKKTIFSTQLSEGAVFLTLGALVSLTGIFSGLGLNNMFGSGSIFLSMFSAPSPIPRIYIVPIWQIIIELTISIGIFMIVIFLATYFVTKQSDIKRISDFFRMA